MSACRSVTLLAIGLLALALPACSWALGSVKFGTPPKLPVLSTVTLKGEAQTTNTKMTNFSVEELLLTEGWNVTVAGQGGEKKSAVFAQYCPNPTCGSDKEGYVSGGFTLPANSLVLNTEGAKFTGGLGTAPTFQCSSGCSVDGASPVKIASEAAVALGQTSTWTSEGFSEKSLALNTKSTLRSLSNAEIYRVNIVWTLSTGP